MTDAAAHNLPRAHLRGLARALLFDMDVR